MAQTKRRSQRAAAEPKLKGGAHAIAAIGPECEQLMEERFASLDPQVFDEIEQAELRALASALGRWDDTPASKVAAAYLDAKAAGRSLTVDNVARWLSSHPNDADAVIDCLSVDPPKEITIIRLLSRAGSQKLVFLATWHLAQRQVVLKRLLGPSDEAARILGRESQTHPLSMEHPNIIETFILPNASDESFLVEEFLPVILSDDYRAPGVEEGANLLYDIASALTFLHDTLGRVHGDVKPDNIGKRRENYVLLDFGIARPIDQFLETTPTGSLRTRAPELLGAADYGKPSSADVWALCATVFSAFAGRFPLLDHGDVPPRITSPQERAEFERELSRRARDEWAQRVNLLMVPEPLRDLLARGLDRDPTTRISARELRDVAEAALAPFLRHSSNRGIGRFSPIEEVDQYRREFEGRLDLVTLMPVPVRQEFKARIADVKDFPGLGDDRRSFLNWLFAQL